MGQPYTVTADLKFKNNDPVDFYNAVKEAAENNHFFLLGKALSKIDPKKPLDIFKLLTSDDVIISGNTWTADFDATYSWHGVMYDIFTHAAKVLDDGSRIVISPWDGWESEADDDVITVENGEVTIK